MTVEGGVCKVIACDTYAPLRMSGRDRSMDIISLATILKPSFLLSSGFSSPTTALPCSPGPAVRAMIWHVAHDLINKVQRRSYRYVAVYMYYMSSDVHVPVAKQSDFVPKLF